MEHPLKTPEGSRATTTVVVLGQDPVIRMVLQRQLDGLGCQTVLVDDVGRLALALQAAPDLVLVDAAMPAPGMEVALAVLGRHDFPVVCMAPDSGPLVPGKDACPSAAGQVSRPPRRDELAAVLRRQSVHGDTTTRGAGPSTVDMAALDDLVTQVGGSDVAGRIVGAFLDSAADRLAALDRARTDGDLLAVERVAHSLKSAAALVGLSAVAAAARGLEADPTDVTAADRVVGLLTAGVEPLRAARRSLHGDPA